LLSSGLVLAAAWAHGAADWILWSVAVVVQLITPYRDPHRGELPINAAHFAERHGAGDPDRARRALVSVALAVSTSMSGSAWHRRARGPARRRSCGGCTSAGTTNARRRPMEVAPPAKRPIWAITGYFLAHFFMIFGILLIAAGTHLAVHDLFAEAPRPAPGSSPAARALSRSVRPTSTGAALRAAAAARGRRAGLPDRLPGRDDTARRRPNWPRVAIISASPCFLERRVDPGPDATVRRRRRG